MAEDVRIRRLVAEDAEDFGQVVGFVRGERQYILPGPPAPIERTRAFVRDNVEHGFPVFVLVDGGQLVGWCDILPAHSNEAIRHVGVLGMGLMPAYRGRGLGERLLRAALDAAGDFGFTRVQLGVFAGNARAVALYRKVGFVEEGVRRGYLLIDGVLIDEIMMARIHPPAEQQRRARSEDATTLSKR